MRRKWIIAPLAALAIAVSGTAAKADSNRVLVPVIVGAAVGAVVGAVVVGSQRDQGARHHGHRNRGHVHAGRGHHGHAHGGRGHRHRGHAHGGHRGPRHFAGSHRQRGGDVYIHQGGHRRGAVIVVGDHSGEYRRRDSRRYESDRGYFDDRDRRGRGRGDRD